MGKWVTGCQCLYTWRCLVARTLRLIWYARYPYVALNQPLSQTLNGERVLLDFSTFRKRWRLGAERQVLASSPPLPVLSTHIMYTYTCMYLPNSKCKLLTGSASLYALPRCHINRPLKGVLSRPLCAYGSSLCFFSLSICGRYLLANDRFASVRQRTYLRLNPSRASRQLLSAISC